MKAWLFLPALLLCSASLTCGQSPRPIRDLNGYFPFTPAADAQAWSERRAEIEQRVRVASGLWPMPEKTPLNAVVHGRVEREDYTIDRVFFESLPGHFVTGSLYLPKNRTGKIPAILCPHGHWPDGRFMDVGLGTEALKKQLDTKAEERECAARSPLQARCVQLARMGCAVFHYDMLGYADSIQFPVHRHGAGPEGFLSPAADLRLQTYFGLHTWNSVRALDFLLSQEGIDENRIGCTGASGGGTQTMMLTGMDPRITAAFPCVMVSTAMQGGCTCENTHYLRINQGNVDIAALTAPRPLGITAADDWTKEVETKGLPDLKKLYAMLGVPDHITAHIATQFPHNYNLPSRLAMYEFFNKHFQLGLKSPIQEQDFTFSTKADLTVWTTEHPAPTGDAVGDTHEKAVCAWMTTQDEKNIDSLVKEADTTRVREVVGSAWETIVGRKTPTAADVAYEMLSKEDKTDFLIVKGRITNSRDDEALEATFLYPTKWNGEASLWLSLKGPSSILEGETPTTAAQKLLDQGIAIACPSLYLEGATEQPKAGDNLKAKPNDFREFSGYTFGYNPTLLARRVHDAMTMVTMMQNQEKYPVKQLKIHGTEGAGPIALVTGVVLKLDGVTAELDGFRFADLTSPWDVNFVPGAVKYGDVEALLKLNGL
ncbi:Acetyl xylan esterase (AXE1) [Prosthecobacter debontii]|uniref:Acetyl xylan esterase (AXE1) n=1 Tax=Prosthecobacter debontii TaxID=48467 RepID=A0A1T4WQH8_9BACT|nr:acetylxylan esterase [Prosthecobacter debontii]SKA79603.1 Acetyl xylan esterase (AXE1) [Prosthecobacter debontii]